MTGIGADDVNGYADDVNDEGLDGDQGPSNCVGADDDGGLAGGDVAGSETGYPDGGQASSGDVAGTEIDFVDGSLRATLLGYADGGLHGGQALTSLVEP